MADEDTEITLGAGKLLGLFFLLAAVCGIFSSRSGSPWVRPRRRSRPCRSSSADTHASAGIPETSGAKPTAVEPMTSESASSEPAKQPEPDLTFYKSVKRNGPETTEPAAPTPRKVSADAAQGGGAKNPEARTPAALVAEKEAARNGEVPSVQNPPATSPNGAFLVQIAAVTHEEDAAALAGALRKKSYAAAVVNSPNGKDKFFHVVLGPYATLQDAEAMKLKLQGEGYNPIVKR